MERDGIEYVREFIPKLQSLIDVLEHDRRIAVHTQVNQFHYMTRTEELKFLIREFDDPAGNHEETSKVIKARYEEVLKDYNRDTQWMQNLR